MKKRYGRYEPADKGSAFPMFSNRIGDNQRRSLYDALVDKGMPEATKSTDTQPWYNPETDAYVQAWPIDQGMVPWSTLTQWKRMIEMRDAWGPSSSADKERNVSFDGCKINAMDYHNLRDDIDRIGRCRVASARMGWKLKPEQLDFLANPKGK